MIEVARIFQNLIQFFSNFSFSHGSVNYMALKVFSIVLLTGVLAFLLRMLYVRLHVRCEQSDYIYDDVLLEAIWPPLYTFVWVLGIRLACFEIMGFVPVIEKIKEVIFLVIFVWFMSRFITGFEQRLESRVAIDQVRLDRTTLRAIGQLLRASVIITALLIGLSVFGVPISGVLAFGGLGGVAVAFAAKDLLSNFFGGLMIYMDRPFEVGDWIRSPDKDIEGTVEHIGWRLTRIRTFDKRPRYVPNSLFSQITVDNASRMQNRRIKTMVGLRYQDADKLKVIIDSIKAMLLKNEDIDQSKIMLVNLVEFGSSSLNLQIYTFTKTTDWAEFQLVQQNVFLNIIDIITEHGASCAFPTRTLHIDKEDERVIER